MTAVILFIISGCLTLLKVDSAPTPVGSSTNVNPTSGGNPLQDMFRNFATFLPPYANPLSYIPNQALPGYGSQFPYAGGNTPFPFAPPGFGQQFIPGGGQGFPAYGGYPFNPTSSTPYGGAPNPAYGNFGGAGGNVPVVTTRLNNQNPGYTTNPNDYQASVSVQSAPGQGPIFRSQTVKGPDGSQGSAFAFSSG